MPAPIEACPSLEGMEQVAPHLMRCEDKHAFMMVPPPRREDDTRMMLAVAFRPIAVRQPELAEPSLGRPVAAAAL